MNTYHFRLIFEDYRIMYYPVSAPTLMVARSLMLDVLPFFEEQPLSISLITE